MKYKCREYGSGETCECPFPIEMIRSQIQLKHYPVVGVLENRSSFG